MKRGTRMKWAALGMIIAMLVVAASAFASAGGELAPFLLRSGEEPGFHAGKPGSATSIHEAVDEYPSKQEAEETTRLTSEGFVGEMYESTHDPKLHSEGASSVIELGSAAQADVALSFQVHTAIAAEGKAALIGRFSVAGVPDARAFTARERHHAGAGANIYWREGNCELFVGDSLATGSASAAAAIAKAGALAVYKRTGNASCP
jgi:hypothetical protein